MGVHADSTSLQIRAYRESDERAVVALWRECGLVRPWNDPVKDIQRKLRVQRDLFLVGTLDGVLVATVMAGYEGHRGWINYLAVATEWRKQGFGRRLMDPSAGGRLPQDQSADQELQRRSHRVLPLTRLYRGRFPEHGQTPGRRLTRIAPGRSRRQAAATYAPWQQAQPTHG